MGKLCRCERCSQVVLRRDGSFFRTVVYVGAYAVTLPWAWLLFVAGPGVVGVIPIVLLLGHCADMTLRDWAFPEPRCERCGASLEHAPAAPASAAPALSAQRA